MSSRRRGSNARRGHSLGWEPEPAEVPSAGPCVEATHRSALHSRSRLHHTAGRWGGAAAHGWTPQPYSSSNSREIPSQLIFLGETCSHLWSADLKSCLADRRLLAEHYSRPRGLLRTSPYPRPVGARDRRNHGATPGDRRTCDTSRAAARLGRRSPERPAAGAERALRRIRAGHRLLPSQEVIPPSPVGSPLAGAPTEEDVNEPGATSNAGRRDDGV